MDWLFRRKSRVFTKFRLPSSISGRVWKEFTFSSRKWAYYGSEPTRTGVEIYECRILIFIIGALRSRRRTFFVKNKRPPLRNESEKKDWAFAPFFHSCFVFSFGIVLDRSFFLRFRFVFFMNGTNRNNFRDYGRRWSALRCIVRGGATLLH